MTDVRFTMTRPEERHGTVQLAVDGEIDVSNVDDFGRSMAECVDTSATVLTLNAAGLTFIDSSGLRVIVETTKRMKEMGGRLVIQEAPEILRRIIEVSGLSEFLGLADGEVQ